MAAAEAAANTARTTAIAVGVVVPVVVIALAVSAWLIWRKRRRAAAAGWDQWNKNNTGNSSAYGNAPVRDANAVEAPTYEHKADSPDSPYSPHAASEMSTQQYSTPEMPDNQHRQELPG